MIKNMELAPVRRGESFIPSTFRLHLTGTGLRLLTPRTPAATTARTT